MSIKKFGESEIDSIVESYITEESTDNIASRFKTTRATIRKYLMKRGIFQPLLMTKIEKQKAVALYQSGLSIKKISQQINRSERVISREISRLGLTRHKIQPKIKEQVIKMYKHKNTITQISKKLDITTSGTTYILKSHKVWKFKGVRKYACNKKFFHQIDTESKAYWLGFIAADGNISRKMLHIGVHRDDRDHLLIFKKDIEATYPIRDTNYMSRGKVSRMSIIEITYKEIADDLFRHGIRPAKTKLLSWEETTKNVPDHLIKHFIRGYFDGDGCWKLSNATKITFDICSASECNFLLSLQKTLASACDLKLTKIYTNKSNGAKNLAYGGNLQMARIYHFMYDDAKVFLTRKKQKAFERLKNYL